MAPRMTIVSPRVKPFVYVGDNSHSVLHSDDESTELTATQSKPIFHRKEEQPMEEEVWWRLNEDFALSGNEREEDFSVNRLVPATTRTSSSSHKSASPQLLSDDEWMEINKDFSLDSFRPEDNEEDECRKPSLRKSAASSGEPNGDYGVWWE